jgi:hypothetical protein
MVCTRCQHGFVQNGHFRWRGPTGDGDRCYSCAAYHRYGKAVCGLCKVPGPALDAFVLQAIVRHRLADHDALQQAMDAFIAAALVSKAKATRTRHDDCELDLFNRKIKATVAMLADPDFDGLDKLRTRLADLKAKRDAVEARLKSADEPAPSAITESELRAWPQEGLARLDDVATRAVPDLHGRQRVETFIDRIEMDQDATTRVVYVMADLETGLPRSSTPMPGGGGARVCETGQSCQAFWSERLGAAGEVGRRSVALGRQAWTGKTALVCST